MKKFFKDCVKFFEIDEQDALLFALINSNYKNF